MLAATNAPETLDAALTRPGRFDRKVAVELPDVRGRLEILNLYLEASDTKFLHIFRLRPRPLSRDHHQLCICLFGT